MDWWQRIQTIPVGYSFATFQNRRFGLSRRDFNQGKSIKVYAEELGGTDCISFNFYRTS